MLAGESEGAPQVLAGNLDRCPTGVGRWPRRCWQVSSTGAPQGWAGARRYLQVEYLRIPADTSSQCHVFTGVSHLSNTCQIPAPTGVWQVFGRCHFCLSEQWRPNVVEGRHEASLAALPPSSSCRDSSSRALLGYSHRSSSHTSAVHLLLHLYRADPDRRDYQLQRSPTFNCISKTTPAPGQAHRQAFTHSSEGTNQFIPFKLNPSLGKACVAHSLPQVSAAPLFFPSLAIGGRGTGPLTGQR